MIHETHEHIPDDFTISVQPVLPWVRFPECPKCGWSLGQGSPTARWISASRGESSVHYAWCKGDQNSAVKVPQLNISTGEMSVGDVKVPCFGIIDEHLHLRCGRCSFQWLMAVKGAGR